MKYKDWLTQWLKNYKKPLVKKQTFARYEQIVELQIAPYLGNYQMKELSVSILQNYIASISNKYAINTTNAIVSIVKTTLLAAKERNLIRDDYTRFLKYHRVPQQNIKCLSYVEQKKIEEYILKSKKQRLFGIVFCLYSGLRIGELLSLQWEDIDLEKRLITVSKNCYDHWGTEGYSKVIESPKTMSSYRLIPLPEKLIPYLLEYKKNCKSQFLVSDNKGGVISVRSYQKTFQALLKKLNIPHMGFHSLRHTFATRALECGMDIKTLSEILGHKNPSITLSTYAHSLIEHKRAMMNKLGDYL